MSVIQNLGISFYNLKEEGSISKIAKSSINDPTINFITQIKDIETIDEIIIDLNNAINGNTINDEVISLEDEVAIITNNGIAFMDYEVENIIYPLYPLYDFKELCEAWRNFLNTPPYNGTRCK